MYNRPKLKDLIRRAKNGDEEAAHQVVDRFKAIVKKYTRRLGDEDAGADLTEWILNAIKNYRPNTTWGRDELTRYIRNNGSKKFFKKN